jgi:hypothetical protein
LSSGPIFSIGISVRFKTQQFFRNYPSVCKDHARAQFYSKKQDNISVTSVNYIDKTAFILYKCEFNGLFLFQPRLTIKKKGLKLTIIIDDAGSGDLLFGVVISAFRDLTREFKYGIIDVKYYQTRLFSRKLFLKECSKIVLKLLTEMKPKSEEEIHLCRGYIFDGVIEKLKRKYGEDRIRRIKVTGEAQDLTETAYLDEIRNLGYEPLEERENRRAKSFFHMMRWLKKNPDKLKYTKTGWPRLQRYRLFKTK